MASEKVSIEESEGKDATTPTTENQDRTCITAPEIENDVHLNTRGTTKLIFVPELATKIYGIGLVQMVFGIFIFCGMGVYLGVTLGERRSRYSYLGESCYNVYDRYEYSTVGYNQGNIIAAIVTGVIVSLVPFKKYFIL